MKRIIFLAALFCLLAGASQLNAQLIIRNSGHAEIGVNPSINDIAINKQQYIFASDIVAGKLVDTGRASGDVTVKSGIEYEIEASGTVTLQDGFKVEKGATFAVYPSSY